jgi:hypothetical protein
MGLRAGSRRVLVSEVTVFVSGRGVLLGLFMLTNGVMMLGLVVMMGRCVVMRGGLMMMLACRVLRRFCHLNVLRSEPIGTRGRDGG